jgi:4-alpha-glucanotransferase
MAEELRRRARELGVATRYRDGLGRWHRVPDATIEAVLAAAGDTAAGPAGDATGGWPPVVVASAGRAPRWRPPAGERAVVALEGGGERPLPPRLPADLPAGYHRVRGRMGESALVVAPARCHLPGWLRDGGRAWGWAVQLYAARSRASWGIGDLGDLARLAAASDRLGAAFLLLNPLHAALAAEASPYSPSSRRFRNPLYVAVEQVPELAALGPPERARVAELAAAGRRLDQAGRIDRVAAATLKEQALRACWRAHQRLPVRRAALAAWRARSRGGDPAAGVDGFATFCALQEELGADWRTWPAALRHPAGRQVAAWRDAHPLEVGYHAWVQWLLEEQLAAVPRLRLGLIADLAVGFTSDGFDAWCYQDTLAPGMSIGAPPDALAPDGQDWRLPPMAPGRLRRHGYQPFAATLRAVLAHAGGIRVDHVLGLFRLFWVPEGAAPADGTYVRYPTADLLGVLALESQRAGALVIGEDLGTVPAGVRARLAARAVLSYRVAWFEPGPAAAWPRLALAAATTHDLPTVTGFFSGADLEHLRDIGVVPAARYRAEAAGQASRRAELRARLAAEGLHGDPVAALHAFLARTPSMLAVAALEDALGVAERPNVPGTTEQRPNWRLPLPLPLEELVGDARVRALARRFRDAGRST